MFIHHISWSSRSCVRLSVCEFYPTQCSQLKNPISSDHELTKDNKLKINEQTRENQGLKRMNKRFIPYPYTQDGMYVNA